MKTTSHDFPVTVVMSVFQNLTHRILLVFIVPDSNSICTFYKTNTKLKANVNYPRVSPSTEKYTFYLLIFICFGHIHYKF